MNTTALDNLTDTQRLLARSLDIASQVVIDYAAPEVPLLGNKTPQGLLEDLGRVNEARKALEKTEKVLKQRMAALLDGADECRSDNFVYKKEATERTALNQSLAKDKLGEFGVLEDCMQTSSVDRVTIKRI